MDKDFSRIERLPRYVFEEINQLKIQARHQGKDIIDFGMGNPDQATPDFIVNKLKETVNKKETHRYSQSKGIPRLRKAISDWYDRKYNVAIDPENEATISDTGGYIPNGFEDFLLKGVERFNGQK